MNIDTQAVLKAAGTKWIFYHSNQNYWRSLHWCRPPFAQRAQEFGYHPEIIAGRRLNDSMADYVASQIVD
jgi:UDP-N-acetyl-D-galactosamine dehydrogenase